MKESSSQMEFLEESEIEAIRETYDLEKNDEIKPIRVFVYFLKTEIASLANKVSDATWSGLWKVHDSFNDDYEVDDQELSEELIEQAQSIYESTSTPEDCKEWLRDMVGGSFDVGLDYGIGENNTDISMPGDYPEEESFLLEVDYKKIAEVVKTNWAKVFSEGK